MNSSRAGLVTCISIWLGLAFVAFVTIWTQRPPAAVAASAPATEFSAERAFRHVTAIAQRPRPIGSAAHAAAREYICQQLRALGLEPQVQATTATDSISASLFFAGSVENVVARKKGAGDGRALLLVAHYDSVATGPGANDDGVGVATLLETARALQASGGALRHDVIFLFSDAEETGLLGARAFVAEHPWAKDVDVVLNFEARGSGGPSIMFETSTQNSALIRALATAAPFPLANSLSYEIYKRLPNSTDLTVFKRAGWQGMNFAYINGLTHYHTQLDNLENVDARTLQHHGSYALALSRYFGDAPLLRGQPEGDEIYFDVLGFFLVRYPAWLAWPLNVGVLISLVGLVFFGVRRGRLSAIGVAQGCLIFLLNLVAAPAAVRAAWWLIRRMHPEYGAIAQGDTYNHGLYVLGFAAIALAVTSLLFSFVGRRIRVADLWVGGLVWWAAVMAATTCRVIGGSYLLTWPLLCALPGLAAELIRPATAARSDRRLIIAAVCAIPGILLIVPFVHLIFIAMRFVLAPALVLPLVLLFALLLPLLRDVATKLRWEFSGTIGVLAVLLFVIAGTQSGFDRNHRQADHVLYFLDATRQRARWLSLDAHLDAWTAQFFGSNRERTPLVNPFPLTQKSSLQAPAPVAAVPPPEASVVEDRTENGVRRLRLHLASPRGAERMSVRIHASVVSAAIQGKRLEAHPITSASRIRWDLSYFGLPKEGIDLDFETKTNPPLLLEVVDESYGWPQLDGTVITARPAEMMPAPFFRSDLSLVSRNYSF